MPDHESDCAVHNEPAMPAGPCDCGTGIVEAMAAELMSRVNAPESEIYAAARATFAIALDHMREPSEGMLAACNGADRLSTAAMVDADNHATWQAMLDQSAKEAFDD